MRILQNRKSFLLGLTFFAVVIFGLIFLVATKSSGNLESRDYLLSARLKTTVPSQTKAAGPASFLEEGTSELIVDSQVKVDFIPEEHNYRAHFQFIDPQLTIRADSPTSDAETLIKEHLVKGFSAAYARDGQLLSLYLDAGLPSMLIDLSWDLAFTLGMKKPEQYSAELLESFEAPRRKGTLRYKWQDDTRKVLTRSIVNMEDILQSANPAAPKSNWTILTSQSQCRYEKDAQFPEECSSHESAELQLGQQILLTGENRITFSQVKAKAQGQNAARVADLTTVAKEPLDLSAEGQRARFRRNLAVNNTRNFSFADEIKVILDQDLSKENWPNEKRMAWAEKIADYLLLHPEKSAEVAELARQLGPDHEFFSLVPYILSVCGHNEAQAELVKLAQDFETNKGAMFNVLSSMLFLETANTASLQYLKTLEAKQVEQTSGIALLAIGKYSGQKGDVGQESLAYVRSKLENGQTEDEKSLALSALGNGGHDENIATLGSYLNSPSVELRKRAVDALRFVKDPQHFDLLMTALSSDKDSSVRTEAAAALQYQTLPQAYLPQVVEVIKQESNTLARIEATKVYIKYCRDQKVCLEKLHELHDRESNGDLQKLLSQEIQRLEARQ